MDEKKEAASMVTYEETKAAPLAVVKDQMAALHELMREVLQEGEDYGKIPGAKKPSLWKSGAEKICTLFRLDPQYDVVARVLEDDFILYDVRCTLYSIRTGQRLGAGLGSCNTREEKYNWRKAITESEYAGTPPDRRREKVYSGSGGSTYVVKQIRTNPYDYLNTVEKMAAKRAKIAATLDVTNASAIFTQDLEDLPKETFDQGETRGATASGESASKSQPPSEPDDKTITEGMARLIHVLLGKLDIKGDKERHEYVQILLVRGDDKPVESFKNLSFKTGKWVIETLQELVAAKGG